MYVIKVMTSHDACTSGTSGVLTVASLQRLNMEALIPAPADREVWSLIKVLNAQSIAPRNSSHLTRRVPSSNPAADQTDWSYFGGFSSVIKSNAVLDLHCHYPFNHYS